MPNKDSYQFALVDQHQLLSGDQLIDLIDSWDGLERWWRNRRNTQEILIGYISYEQGYQFMDAPQSSVLWRKKLDQLTLPPVLFGRFRRGTRYHLRLPPTLPTPSLGTPQSMSQIAYKKIFRRAQQYIKLGDIYQVNLSHRLVFANPTIQPADLFWQMYAQQPTAYAGFIQLPDYAILSSSPELFLRVKDQQVETRPMKGTRPRGRTATQDQKLQRELLNSRKELAELDMIIDVHRNDLQRTAQTGSVRVQRRRELIPYHTVWQAQARIVAKLKKSYSPLDLIRTTFPAGSITGAPKLHAMEIIHELEAAPRHVYCGAMGYITARGDMSFNVAIRTGIHHRQKFYYYVGGGITTDSVLSAEWQETFNKARQLGLTRGRT